jgi:hypothetical protein
MNQNQSFKRNKRNKRNAKKKKKRTHLKGYRNTRRTNKRKNKRKTRTKRKLVGGMDPGALPEMVGKKLKDILGELKERISEDLQETLSDKFTGKLQTIMKKVNILMGEGKPEKPLLEEEISAEKTIIEYFNLLFEKPEEEEATKQKIKCLDTKPTEIIAEDKLEYAQKKLALCKVFAVMKSQVPEKIIQFFPDPQTSSSTKFYAKTPGGGWEPIVPGDHLAIQRGGVKIPLPALMPTFISMAFALVGVDIAPVDVRLYTHHGIYIGENDEANPNGKIIHYRFDKARVLPSLLEVLSGIISSDMEKVQEAFGAMRTFIKEEDLADFLEDSYDELCEEGEEGEEGGEGGEGTGFTRIVSKKRLPPKEIVARAKSQLGQKHYDLLGGNCESEACYQSTGDRISKQTAPFAKFIGLEDSTKRMKERYDAAGEDTAGLMSLGEFYLDKYATPKTRGLELARIFSDLGGPRRRFFKMWIVPKENDPENKGYILVKWHKDDRPGATVLGGDRWFLEDFKKMEIKEKETKKGVCTEINIPRKIIFYIYNDPDDETQKPRLLQIFQVAKEEGWVVGGEEIRINLKTNDR